jgi:DNA polymerase elongation subunit (family B)
LWDDETGYEQFQYEKYAYIVDSKGSSITMDGVKVRKVADWSKEAEKQGLVYEHDVPILTRILVDRYHHSDEVSKNHRIMILDIEVAKEGKYSTAKEAANTITAISYYLKETGYVCLLLDKNGKLNSRKKAVKTTSGREIEVDLQIFRNEKMMLTAFVSQFARIRPTITSHWNGELYDMPYLVNRIKGELGNNVASKLSEIGIVYTEPVNDRDDHAIIAGVACFDYLMLYKKFSINDRPRFTLDYISKQELGRGKKKYAGTLDDLYENDPEGFIEYNIDDVELVVSLDEKLDFIFAAQGLCHTGHVPYEDIIFSSRYLEGASLTYCKRNNLIAMKTIPDGNMDPAMGAFVKLPKPGLYKYIFDEDLSGMYPGNIMSLNISPETKYGRVENFNGEEFSKDVKKSYKIIPRKKVGTIESFEFSDTSDFIVEDLRAFLQEKNLSISANGIMYSKDKIGLIPAILKKWGSDRKEYRKQAEIAKLSGDLEKYKYYDRNQYRVKILGNSFYGYLLLYGSRFNDRENGEATTQTGVQLIKQSMKVADWYYNKKLGNVEPKEYVVYSDTDSIFLPALPLIENADSKTDEELVQDTLKISAELQTVINKYYDKYADRFHNVSEHYWNIKQELVSRRAFWGSAKKRYAMWIINKNGLPFDEAEIKGFDVVRSSFPQAFRDFMESIIGDILHDILPDELNKKIRDFKYQYKNNELSDILLPSGVKEISKYQTATKSIPIHVNSSLNYNKLLNLFNIEGQYPVIDDGDKIMWGYLRQNPYNFNTLAIRGYDDPPEILEFMEKYTDREKIFEKSLISKLQSIWDDLGWGQISLNENNDDFF